MKKIYILFVSLLALLGGFTPAFAQDDEVVLEISRKTGNWTASGSPAYASEYATSKYSAEAATPGVRIQHWNRSNGHNNNMYFYDGTNLGIYSSYGGTASEDYRIYPSKGYYVYGISLDFIPGKHPSYAMNGVRVWANGEEENAVTSPDADTPGHYEIDGLLEDEEYIPLTIGQLAEDGNPIFAHTYNFTVTLRVKDPLLVAIDELYALTDAYATYTEDGSTPFIGDGKPGNYDAAAVATFNEVYLRCLSGGEDPESVDQLKALVAELEAAYQAVVASKVMEMPLADGYYRFRTAIDYNDGETKYMYVVNNSGSITGNWGTREDVQNDCQSLFQIKNVGDGVIDIISMSTDARFNENPGTLSYDSENQYVIEPVTTIDDVTYVDILRNGVESGGYGYIHQAGHGSGAGTGSNLTIWYPSYPTSTSNKMGGTEWVIEAVDETVAQAIIDAYAPTKDHERLIANFTNLLEEANQAVKDAKDIQEYTELITEGSQFSSPWTETREGVGKEDYGWDGLLDGDNKTYWHSDWTTSVENHTHWLDVTLNEPVHELIQLKITRRPVASDHITLWGVFGSNEQEVADVLYTEDDEEVINGEKAVGDVKVEGHEVEWTELASLSTPFGTNTETITSKDFDTQGFKYLRFYIDGTTTGRGYGHVSEFQLVLPVANPKAQFGFMGEVATNLDALLRELNDLSEEEITEEYYNALVEAYEAFKALYVDPTELRELLASIEGIAAGVIVGTAPGYWPDTSTGDALKATYDNAKAYDEAGVYVAATSEQYIETLKAQVEAVQEAAYKVQEGKWYRIHFGSKATAEANEWDVQNNESIVVETTDGEVTTNEALWDKYIVVAALNTETVTVSIPATDEDGEAEDSEITINTIVPYEEDGELDPGDIRMGDNLYLDADADIAIKDLSMFRFVLVGDSAYAIQNKGTGLYLNSGSGVKLSIIPSLYSVKAVGYGQNVISGRSLQGADQSNFNAQRVQNRLVMYGEATAGSRSAFYIEEAGAVAGDYDGSEFQLDINPGEIYSHCYPVDLSTTDEAGKMYVASELEVTDETVKMTLAPVEGTLPAGHPFFYIYDDPEVYNPEAYAEVITFKHGSTFTATPLAKGYMLGTFSQKTLGEGYIVAGSTLRDYLGQYASEELKRNQFFITSKFITNSVTANSAYVCWTELLSDALDLSVELSEEPVEVGIEQIQALQKHLGELYTMDGRLLGRGVSFSDVKRYGKGLYILNGVKVVVK